MKKVCSCLMLIWVFVLGGCATKPITESNSSDKGIVLDQTNAKAKGNKSWFNSGNEAKQKFSQKYNGEIDPATAFYLEYDTYIYEDKKIVAYLQKIIDRLLQGWQGEKPELSVVLITDEFFNAYVDELNQLHVTTGLLRNVENEDQLAAILAHEISHILLKHNPEKSSVNSVTSGLEMGGIIAETASIIMGDEDLGKQAWFGFTSLGLVWADLLSPGWSRKNELEADKMGMDLLMRANYNYEQFPVVLEKIGEGEGKKSAHLNKMIKGLDPSEQPDASTKEQSAALTKKLNDEVSSKNKSHEDRATRIKALKDYLNTAYAGGELPPANSEAEFRSTVYDPISKAQLDQDYKAIETINALSFRDVERAKTKAASLPDSKLNLVSSKIAKSSVEISEKNYGDAINNLLSLIDHNYAPAEAYIKLASVYMEEKKYDEAGKILNLGIKRIGRDYKFLPALVNLYKTSGDKKTAEGTTKKCRDYDKTVLLSSESGDSYYKNCVAILGYDPDERVLVPAAKKIIPYVLPGIELLRMF
ncbi:Putative Zn-dependent protease, contains TPR repeats [Nitrosospira sp. Nsp18]|uniref:M48 family metallopeptidase n=1 Tax=Nitrosospira sp. Nsp18 TaxID=1855334 RepID=UPI00088AF842|nr:M48 family metallopeptidase [Nitrosospira sp. Nsp18]SDA12273.1 Putative Zn-dependent protease, contains TPR repeats [Nitrosospira sp. Nsp18]